MVQHTKKAHSSTTFCMSGLLFILSVLSCFQHNCSCAAASPARLASEVTTLRNRTFNRSLLFASDAATDLSCARQCMDTARCSSFTFTHKAGKCRGHSDTMTSGDLQAVSTPGTTYYQTDDWLEKTCTVDDECKVDNAECYAGRCLCTPGYFYSHSTMTCIPECAVEDLQDSLLTYPDLDLFGLDIANFSSAPLSMQECRTFCITHTQCVTAELVDHNVGGSCFLKNVTTLEFPDRVRVGVPRQTHFQRTCV